MWDKMSNRFQSMLIRYVFLVLVFTTSSSNAADTTKGGALYALHCADCHGTTGISVIPFAPNFAQNESLMQPDSYLLTAINKGNNAMPSYQGILSEHDILDVIAYLRTLN
jgi:mono/diheme cytochrome c family protein